MCLHTVICCVSLVYAADGTFQISVDPAPFHIFYDPARLHTAIAAVAAFALLSIAFCFARFSFGYAVGFYFYTMISGYLWLNCFSDLNYDHKSSALSAAVSAVTFLVPALFIGSPIRQVYAVSAGAFDRPLTAILLLAAAAVISGALYNFRLVGIADIYDFRDRMESPAIVNYSALPQRALPFVCGLCTQGNWRAAALLLLIIRLPRAKARVCAAPAAALLLSKVFDAKTTVIASESPC